MADLRHTTRRGAGLYGTGLGYLLALLVSGTLTGCESDSATKGQVLAIVNKDEISVHQLNFALANARSRPNTPEPREAMLETMIDRQLAVQEALAMNLHRRPDVLMRLEEMRLETLANAYAAEMAKTLTAPSDEQIAAYFRQHPGLFERRKIYRLHEVMIGAQTRSLSGITQRLNARQPLTETMAWLRKQEIPHTEQTVWRPAEDLPVEVVARLLDLPPDSQNRWVTFQTPAGLLIYEVLSAEPAPMAWTQAAPIIRNHLRKEKERIHIKTLVAQLRQKGSVSRNHQEGLPK